jgi:type IV secretory pathway VirD2 relaxase
MRDDPEFLFRPGRIRTQTVHRQMGFINKALAAAQKAGARVDRNGLILKRTGGRFGRGRAGAIAAYQGLSVASRQVVIKARVVRRRGHTMALSNHLRYLSREGVAKDSARPALFGPNSDEIDPSEFAARCQLDRHHFRFIVSPDDAPVMEDLNAFTRDLMRQAQIDLDTPLDWTGVTHWNTEHPHIHILVRGVTDQGEDLVIARDYIKFGLRARASTLITQELGLRTDNEIRHAIARQVGAERFTDLDRHLSSEMKRHGFIDMAPHSALKPDPFHIEKMGRMRKLEALGLADQFAPSQWIMAETAEQTLRALGERGDIIKRLHNSLTKAGLERVAASWDLSGEEVDRPVIGRLLDRGLDDEHKGSAYIIIDAIDGHIHHIRLNNLDEGHDSALGSIVEYVPANPQNAFESSRLWVRSDLTLDDQIRASGATWIDRLAVTGGKANLAASGYGETVRQAIKARAHYLVEKGLARLSAENYRYDSDLLKTLTRHDLDLAAQKIAKETGLTHIDLPAGTPFEGIVKRRLDLASGRFCVLENGMGFRLVPWSRGLENRIGLSAVYHAKTAVSIGAMVSHEVSISGEGGLSISTTEPPLLRRGQ